MALSKSRGFYYCLHETSKLYKNLFNNYSRQIHARKELIIIVNKNNIPLAPYLSLAKKLPNVHVYRLPERTSSAPV